MMLGWNGKDHSNLCFISSVYTTMKFLLGVCLLLSFFACEREEAPTLCNTEGPVRNMEWLKNTTIEIQSDPKYFSVII